MEWRFLDEETTLDLSFVHAGADAEASNGEAKLLVAGDLLNGLPGADTEGLEDISEFRVPADGHANDLGVDLLDTILPQVLGKGGREEDDVRAVGGFRAEGAGGKLATEERKVVDDRDRDEGGKVVSGNWGEFRFRASEELNQDHVRRCGACFPEESDVIIPGLGNFHEDTDVFTSEVVNLLRQKPDDNVLVSLDEAVEIFAFSFSTLYYYCPSSEESVRYSVRGENSRKCQSGSGKCRLMHFFLLFVCVCVVK